MTDYKKIEEEHGREYLKNMQDPYDPDPALDEYLRETDTGLENDDLGRDERGEREDD